MKKTLLFLAVWFAAVLLFASCGADTEDGVIDSADIEDGVIDIGSETVAALPYTVDVEGLEDVSGTVSVALVGDAAKADALSKVKEGYYVSDGAATYAVEISLKKNGEDVALEKPVTVKIGLKTHDLPLDQYTVFHIHGDRVTETVPTVTEDSLTFSVSDFSIFLVVPKHVHTPGTLVVDTAANCTATGTGHIPCSVCGKTVETQTIGKAAHAPSEWISDGTGKVYKECTVCREVLEEKTAADHWDADLIAAAFRAVGATEDVSLPKLDCAKSMTKSDLVGGKVTVTIQTASDRAAIEAAGIYKGQTIPYAFEYRRSAGNFEYYLTAHNEAEFGLWVEQTSAGATVTIEITAFRPAYPANEINACLVDRDVTDGIIDFRCANAVEYAWNDGTLHVYLQRDALASDVTRAYADDLTKNGRYTVEVVSGSTYYVSENRELVLSLSSDTSGSRPVVSVGFLSPSILPLRAYPAALIDDLLTGTDDDFFNFAEASATEYRPYYEAGSGAFEAEFWILLPAEVDGAEVAAAIKSGFVALGYKRNDLRFTAEGQEGCRRNDCLVSPDREIAVYILGYDVGQVVAWGTSDGTYCYAIVTVINLTRVEDLAWVTSIEAAPNTNQYFLGAGFYLDVRVAAVFSNGTKENLWVDTSEGGTFTNTVPDTDTEGIKTVTVTYLGRFTDDYEISVEAYE